MHTYTSSYSYTYTYYKILYYNIPSEARTLRQHRVRPPDRRARTGRGIDDVSSHMKAVTSVERQKDGSQNPAPNLSL